MKPGSIFPALLAAVLVTTVCAPARAQTPTGGSLSARPLITQKIDSAHLITLEGNVRADLTPDRDLGPVEDGLPVHLYVVLQRSPEQQADLDNFLARQQQPTAPEFHKWLTPQEFGERFGVSQHDIKKISAWLESQGLHVNGVLNNATFIDVTANAGQVRTVFHTQMHYYNIQGGKYAANAQDPMIPAALQRVVAGIEGLAQIPHATHHTPIRPTSYDAPTHTWHNLDAFGKPEALPAFSGGGGTYNITPQDFYTIYNVNPVFSAGSGNLGAGTTIAVPEESDMTYGTVDPTTGVATGGDVVTFRNLFGITGTLNMHVYHGYGAVTCDAPGIIQDVEGEATLDAEWANALAPAANLIFISCDSATGGFVKATMALVDNNISDAIGISYGFSELQATSTTYATNDTLFSQAAAQGQTVFVAAGDAGSDTGDQNTKGTATLGLNIDVFSANPLITSAGGTDFSDLYDSLAGGPAQNRYWGATNSASYGDALGYIPETTWNGSCASTLTAALQGFTNPADFCAVGLSTNDVNGSVVGGGGGFSTHYFQPSWQSGIPGLSSAARKRATPDISMFASSGVWSHALITCDSSLDQAASACTSSSTFGSAGGTSFVAPQLAGIAGLLVNYTGTRQGLWNPTLYALAKAQFTASATSTSCYSNGQTANTGVTTGLPDSTCIFNDVTTSNNDVPCQVGSTNCYVDSGATYGLLSTTGANSLTIGFPSGPEYDLSTGLGSINVYNLFTNWNGAFTTTTALMATPESSGTLKTTKLTATVTPGTPKGYVGTAPALTGSVSFAAEPRSLTSLGGCTVSGGTCSLTVDDSVLQPGANSITATFSGSATYPASTSSIVTATVPEVANFTLEPDPQAAETKSDLARFTLQLKSVNGFNGMVTLTCAGGPAGSQCIDDPPTVSVNGTAPAVSSTFSVPQDAKPGTYIVTFTGRSSSLTHTATAKLTVVETRPR